MRSLIKNLIKESRITIFLTLVIAIWGMYSYRYLPRQENPDVSAPFAMIVTPYPGASPVDVDNLVSKKIEEELLELDKVDETKTISKDSISIVTIMFENTVDVDKSMQDVRNAVADVKSELPAGVYASNVNTDLLETAGILISLSGENYSYERLASFGEQFKSELQVVNGISKFNIEGELDKEVKIDVDIRRLNQLGLSFEDLNKVLQAQNIEIPSGSIDLGENKIPVKVPGIYTNVKDIANVIIGISPETGVVTRLSDIADVYMDTEDGAEKFKQDGKNAVLLTGFFKDSENVVLVGEEVRAKIDKVKSRLPEDLIVNEVIYQPSDVAKSTNDFMINLMEGILLVVIVVFIGMGLRNALAVSTAIPLSILMTFIAMSLFKIKIHQMSLTALIISLGILVDNAIVISDAIQVKVDEGMERAKAALEATMESSVPIFVATLTTIAAFSPLLGLPGPAGDFIGTIPVVLIIAIIAAYIVAMLAIPAYASLLFKKNENKGKKENRFRKFFEDLLKKALRVRRLTIIGVFLTLYLTIRFVMPQLPSEFFPYVDKNLFYVEIKNEKSGDIDSTEALIDEVGAVLTEEPEITEYTSAIGNGMPKFYITVPPATPAMDYGQIVCKFDFEKGDNRFDDRLKFIAYLQEKIDKNVASGEAIIKPLANAEPGEKIKIMVSGEDIEQIGEVAKHIKEEIAKLDGVTNLGIDLKDKSLELKVDVDTDKAANLGVSKYDIQRQINIALYGSVPSIYRRNGSEYNIKLKSNIDDSKLLENMMIKSSMTGKKVPLKQFATITYNRKVDTIKRYKGDKTVMITADALPGYSPVEIENIVENEIIPNTELNGLTISYDGERESIKDNFGVLLILAGAAVFLIYVILTVQFNSFMQPVVILMTIPLSLIGSVTGLFLFNKPLSLTAFLGIIALIGLVVKNGILLIEYINMAREAGMNVEDACVDAVDKRFNAIILSAVTTILGLLPLAIAGSSLFSPMAISLMAGLAVSTFLTMVIIPVFYVSADAVTVKAVNKVKHKK
ncbi:MAG: efflux RND transporter permease subunit [Clostridia bacterium]|jgi:multidrug efflux pump subunit AcrB|nr:efflux RND transporter permease subunit [Clostridia bacterium]